MSSCPACASRDVEYVSSAASVVCNACGAVLASTSGSGANSGDLVAPELRFGGHAYGLGSVILAGDVRVRAPRLAMPGRRAGEQRWVPGQEALRDKAERRDMLESRNMPALVRHLGGVLARAGAPAGMLEQAKVLFTQARIMGRAHRLRALQQASARGEEHGELSRTQRALGETRWGMLSEHMATVVAWATMKRNRWHRDLEQLVVENGQRRSIAHNQLARLKRLFHNTPILAHLNHAEPSAYVSQYFSVLQRLRDQRATPAAATKGVPPKILAYLACMPDWARAEALASSLARVCEAEGLFKLHTGPGVHRDAHLVAYALVVAAIEGTIKKASPVYQIVALFDQAEQLRVEELERREGEETARAEERREEQAAANDDVDSNAESHGSDDADNDDAASRGETDFAAAQQDEDVPRREAVLQRLRELRRMVTPWMRALPWFDDKDTLKTHEAKQRAARKKRQSSSSRSGKRHGSEEMEDADAAVASRADFASYLADVVAFRDAIATRALQAEHARADECAAADDALMAAKLGAVRAQLRAADEARQSRRTDGWARRFLEAQRHSHASERRPRVPARSEEKREIEAFVQAETLEQEVALLLEGDAESLGGARAADEDALQTQQLHALASMLDEQAQAMPPASARAAALPHFLLLDEQELACAGARVSAAAALHSDAAVDALLFAPAELEGYFFTPDECRARAAMAERLGMWQGPAREASGADKPHGEKRRSKRTLQERAQEMGLHVIDGRLSKARRVDVETLLEGDSRGVERDEEREMEMEIVEEAGDATPMRYTDVSEEEEEEEEEEE